MTTYKRDTPCRKCGSDIFFICNRKCMACHRVLRRKHSVEYDKKRNMNNPWMALLRSSVQRAKKKGIQHELNYNWARSNWTGKCAITGLEFIKTGKKVGGNPFSPSIDRINSKIGYTKDNCRFILFAVNSLKHTGNDDDMKKIIIALYHKLVV